MTLLTSPTLEETYWLFFSHLLWVLDEAATVAIPITSLGTFGLGQALPPLQAFQIGRSAATDIQEAVDDMSDMIEPSLPPPSADGTASLPVRLTSRYGEYQALPLLGTPLPKWKRLPLTTFSSRTRLVPRPRS